MDIHMADVQNITRLPTPSPPTTSSPESYDDHRSQHTPLIIDNGSTTIRYGFSTSPTPRTGVNAVAKYKERKYNKPLLLFGDGIEAESGAKGQARTPWEGDVLLNFDALVCGFFVWMARCDEHDILTSRHRKTLLTMRSFNLALIHLPWTIQCL